MPGSKNTILRVLSVPDRGHGNPYFRLLIDELERLGIVFRRSGVRSLLRLDYDVLHVNFPTHYVTQFDRLRAGALSTFFLSVLTLVRSTGRAVVYTVHDVSPLTLRNERLFWSFLDRVHRRASGYVFLSTSSRSSWVGRHPDQIGKPWTLAPAGPYEVRHRNAAERLALRRSLGFEPGDMVVGFLGAIKDYKGLEEIARLQQKLLDGRPVRVLVAGRMEADYQERGESILREIGPDRVVRIDRSLPDDELDGLLQAVDVALLPYKRGSNSGAALLALSNHTRVLGSDLPIFRELSHHVGRGWATTYRTGPDGDLAAAIEWLASHPVDESDVASLKRYLAAVSFARAAERIARLYRRLARPR